MLPATASFVVYVEGLNATAVLADAEPARRRAYRRALKGAAEFEDMIDRLINCIQIEMNDYSFRMVYGDWFETTETGSNIEMKVLDATEKQLEDMTRMLQERSMAPCMCDSFKANMVCGPEEPPLLIGGIATGDPLSAGGSVAQAAASPPPPLSPRAPQQNAGAFGSSTNKTTGTLAWAVPSVCALAALAIYAHRRKRARDDERPARARQSSDEFITMLKLGSFSADYARANAPIAMHSANPLYSAVEEDVMHVNPLHTSSVVDAEDAERSVRADTAEIADACGTAAHVREAELEVCTQESENALPARQRALVFTGDEPDDEAGKRSILEKIARLRHVRRQSIELVKAQEQIKNQIDTVE